jgi:methylamine dehydrogenase accessory protein MauD
LSGIWVAAFVALWIIVAVLAVLVMGLLRQLGLMQLRLGIEPGVLITSEGLERGKGAPDFEASDVRTGQTVRTSEFRGRRLALVFLTPTCVACRELVPHLNDVARERRRETAMLAVCFGATDACARLARETGIRVPLVADPTNVVGAHYEVRSTPFAFLVDANGTILIRGIVNSWPQIEALLDEEGTFQGTMPWQAVPNGSADLSGGVFGASNRRRGPMVSGDGDSGAAAAVITKKE